MNWNWHTNFLRVQGHSTVYPTHLESITMSLSALCHLFSSTYMFWLGSQTLGIQKCVLAETWQKNFYKLCYLIILLHTHMHGLSWFCYSLCEVLKPCVTRFSIQSYLQWSDVIYYNTFSKEGMDDFKWLLTLTWIIN